MITTTAATAAKPPPTEAPTAMASESWEKSKILHTSEYSKDGQ